MFTRVHQSHVDRIRISFTFGFNFCFGKDGGTTNSYVKCHNLKIDKRLLLKYVGIHITVSKHSRTHAPQVDQIFTTSPQNAGLHSVFVVSADIPLFVLPPLTNRPPILAHSTRSSHTHTHQFSPIPTPSTHSLLTTNPPPLTPPHPLHSPPLAHSRLRCRCSGCSRHVPHHQPWPHHLDTLTTQRTNGMHQLTRAPTQSSIRLFCVWMCACIMGVTPPWREAESSPWPRTRSMCVVPTARAHAPPAPHVCVIRQSDNARATSSLPENIH